VRDGNDFLIRVAAGPDTADMALLARGEVPAPEIELQLLARFTRSLAALWQNAAPPSGSWSTPETSEAVLEQTLWGE
jgi:hypothetical protein